GQTRMLYPKPFLVRNFMAATGQHLKQQAHKKNAAQNYFAPAARPRRSRFFPTPFFCATRFMQTELTDAASHPSPEFAHASPTPNRRYALGWILALTLVWLGLAPAASAQGFGALREIFTDLTGSTLQNLTNNSNYPDHPASSELMTNYFEGPYNYGDHYGDRYRALLIPPLSGTYVFWVQGQNAAALSLSTDESPFDRTQIAVSAATSFYRQYYAYPSQQSVSIFLQAGRRYYIEGIHSSGNGNDSFSAGWKLPNGVVEMPIPGTRLIPFGSNAVSPPSLTSQPLNLTLAENSLASFRVGVSNLDAVTYQWQRNSSNIAGVRGATHT